MTCNQVSTPPLSVTLDYDNMAPPKRNEGQPLTVIDSNVDLTAQLALQLTDFFHLFIPVTRQSETTTHINPTLRPVTANNNHSISTQFPATVDRAAATTFQIRPTNLWLANNQALSRAPSLTACQRIITSASVLYTIPSWLNYV